ncbi:sulfur carrier protein ThiS [Nitrolancea hollandica]|nr:sulfur carrier protein ThiS [Nitrolancea hollandica]
MQVKLNGKLVKLDAVGTVAELLEQRNLRATLVAVEQNGTIVPRAEFDRRAIRDGDELEIVHFVGGG